MTAIIHLLWSCIEATENLSTSDARKEAADTAFFALRIQPQFMMTLKQFFAGLTSQTAQQVPHMFV